MMIEGILFGIAISLAIILWVMWIIEHNKLIHLKFKIEELKLKQKGEYVE